LELFFVEKTAKTRIRQKLKEENVLLGVLASWRLKIEKEWTAWISLS